MGSRSASAPRRIVGVAGAFARLAPGSRGRSLPAARHKNKGDVLWGAYDGNHGTGRALSGAVHGDVPEADGFLFASRFTDDSCVAIFERAFGRLRESGIAELIRHVGFLEALDGYDILLTAPPGRAK